MKKRIAIMTALVLMISALFGTFSVAFARSVIYEDSADKFVAIDDYGANLFKGFENAAPGGSFTQKISLTNDAHEETSIKVYIRLKTYYKDLENCLKEAKLRIEDDEQVVEDAAERYIGGVTDDILIGKCDFNENKSIFLTLTLPENMSEEQIKWLKEADWMISAKKASMDTIEAYSQEGLQNNYIWLFVAISIVFIIAAVLAVMLYEKKRRRKNKFLNR